jgi:hypothetical protein
MSPSCRDVDLNETRVLWREISQQNVCRQRKVFFVMAVQYLGIIDSYFLESILLNNHKDRKDSKPYRPSACLS